jgi:hypothetical protein
MKRKTYNNISKIKELILECGLLEKAKESPIDQRWIDLYTNFEKAVNKLMPIRKQSNKKQERT